MPPKATLGIWESWKSTSVQGPLHTRDWEPVTITLQALSLVERDGAGPSLLPTTLEKPTEYGYARWMESLHGFLHGIKWSMFHGHLDCYQKPLLGGKPNTKPWDHGTPHAHNRWFILLYHVWGSAWIETHLNSVWLRARSHTALHYTWGSVTTLHDVGGCVGTSVARVCVPHTGM